MQKQLEQPPRRVIHSLAIFVLTLIIGLVLAIFLSRISNNAADFASHTVFLAGGILMIMISGLGLTKLNFLPKTKPKGNLKQFAALAIIFGAISGLYNFAPPITKVFMSPEGWALSFLFQALYVGWSEEILFRGALQNILNGAIASDRRIMRFRIGTLISSVIFGVMHLPNVLIGQSVSSAIANAVFALVFGLAVGQYYDNFQDLAGAAWIHNITDGFSTLLSFLVSVL